MFLSSSFYRRQQRISLALVVATMVLTFVMMCLEMAIDSNHDISCSSPSWISRYSSKVKGDFTSSFHGIPAACAASLVEEGTAAATVAQRTQPIAASDDGVNDNIDNISPTSSSVKNDVFRIPKKMTPTELLFGSEMLGRYEDVDLEVTGKIQAADFVESTSSSQESLSCSVSESGISQCSATQVEKDKEEGWRNRIRCEVIRAEDCGSFYYLPPTIHGIVGCFFNSTLNHEEPQAYNKKRLIGTSRDIRKVFFRESLTIMIPNRNLPFTAVAYLEIPGEAILKDYTFFAISQVVTLVIKNFTGVSEVYMTDKDGKLSESILKIQSVWMREISSHRGSKMNLPPEYYYLEYKLDTVLMRTIGMSFMFGEGHTGFFSDRIILLQTIVKSYQGPITVCEIGFNAGHSALAFLTARGYYDTTVKVISFDLGAHRYVRPAAKYIQSHFPGRHILHIGNSHETISKFSASKNSPLHQKCNIIFIDGDHSEEGAYQDIVDSANLAVRDNHLVIFDDMTMPSVVKAWERAEEQGIVREEGSLEGLRNECANYDMLDDRNCRSLVFGNYIF